VPIPPSYFAITEAEDTGRRRESMHTDAAPRTGSRRVLNKPMSPQGAKGKNSSL